MTNDDDESRTDENRDRAKISRRARSDGRSLTCSLCSFKSFDYYPDEDAFQALFDPESINPSEAIVGVISEAEGIDPVDVESLTAKTDVEALDDLITNRRQFEGDVHVSFTLQDYDISLSSYGSIVVRRHTPTRT